MTENAPTSTPAESFQRFTESLGARIAWTAAKAGVAAIVTASIAMGTGYVREMRDDIKAATARTTKLEMDQRLTTDRLENLQKVSDATVAALTQISNQVTRQGFDIEQMKGAAASDAMRIRPRR